MNLSSLFNTHFQSINTDINYVQPALLEIMPELHKVPVIHEVCPESNTCDNKYFECFLSLRIPKETNISALDQLRYQSLTL